MTISRFTFKREAILIAILSYEVPIIGLIVFVYFWLFGGLGE
jgi:hypothetical protein